MFSTGGRNSHFHFTLEYPTLLEDSTNKKKKLETVREKKLSDDSGVSTPPMQFEFDVSSSWAGRILPCLLLIKSQKA